jgi:hypothetical protein
LLSIFLNIEYNPALDKKLLDDSTTADEALEEVSDAPMGDDIEPAKAASQLPPPAEENTAGLEVKMGELHIVKE